MSPTPGLPDERTALAWQRTAVAVLVLSVVATGVTARLAHPLVLLGTALAVAVAAAAALVVVPRTVRGPTSAYPRLLVVAVAVVVLGLASAAAAVGSAGVHHGF